MTAAPTDPLGFNFGLDFKAAPDRLVGEGDERAKNAGRLLPYHVGFLDDYLRGITTRDLVLLGAYPGVGKTDIASNIAAANAGDKRNVYMFALEAEPLEIERRIKYRLVASLAHKRDLHVARELNFVDWYLGRLAGKLGPLEREVDEIIGDNLRGLHTYYKGKDFTGADVHRLCLAVQDKADLIVIDHLHYVDIDDERSENSEYKKLVKTIRDIVLATGRPILLVVHLRKKGMASPVVPGLDEIHGSSDIAKIATTAIMLARAPSSITTPDTNHAPTLVSIPKWRLGGACRQVALCTYDLRTRSYKDSYTLGRLEGGDREWSEIIPDATRPMPSWARRFKGSGVNGGLSTSARRTP
jgi:hypothetical protein